MRATSNFAAAQHLQERFQVFPEDGVGLLEKIAVGGVHHVGGGETVMDPFALLAEALGDGAREGHHVVAGLLLDLLDALHFETGIGADLLHILRRDDAQLAPGGTGQDLHLQVGVELVLFGPDVPHHLAGITLDHRALYLLRNALMFFSMRAAASSSAAGENFSPVMCS